MIRHFDLIVLTEFLATGRGGAMCQFPVLKRGFRTQVLTYKLPLKFTV